MNKTLYPPLAAPQIIVGEKQKHKESPELYKLEYSTICKGEWRHREERDPNFLLELMFSINSGF
jgi:hypothetical protein